MESEKASSPRDWREWRRMRAWELHGEGWTGQEIAEALGVSQAAVSQWLKRAREGGVQALKSQPRAGAAPRLTEEQQAELLEHLTAGAEAYGFYGDVWTLPRIAIVIKKEFGVQYHSSHVGRLLRRLGWSVQKPVIRATQRDEAAIRDWVEKRWPELKKEAEAAGRTILWIDESAFYLLPGCVRTWAPRGESPVLRAYLSRDHLSVISAMTADGKLYLQVLDHALCGADVVRFLQQLRRQIAGQLLVIWDGAPIHHGQAVREFLAQGGAHRIRLEQLPAYAPELNPDEGIWHYLKHVELRNVCCDDLAELRHELMLAVRRLRRKPQVIQSCVAHAGCAA
jgi:transposase